MQVSGSVAHVAEYFMIMTACYIVHYGNVTVYILKSFTHSRSIIALTTYKVRI